MIGLINKISPVKIPLIPKVSFANEKSAGGTDRQGTVNGAYMATHSHASGVSDVPYDGYLVRAHKGERVLTSVQNDEYTNGKGRMSVQFGDIHLHGVGGDLNKAADKLMDIIANKIQIAGGAGA